jgi:hypothetical protein
MKNIILNIVTDDELFILLLTFYSIDLLGFSSSACYFKQAQIHVHKCPLGRYTQLGGQVSELDLYALD